MKLPAWIPLAILCGLAGFATPTLAQGKLSPLARAAMAAQRQGDPVVAWIYLRDKGARAQRQVQPEALVTPRSIDRRLKVRAPERVVDVTDLPLEPSYVRQIAARVLRVRQRSKWFNAVSVAATREQIAALEALPIVSRIDLVTRFRGKRPALDPEAAPLAPKAAPAPRSPATLDYGPSDVQVLQLKVPAVHDRGITGQNVLIAHFDDGYRLLSHEAFASLQVVALYDFVDHDPDPVIPPGADLNVGGHGIVTLSVLAGFKPGHLIGTAFGARFLLARTEDDYSESPLEEDNWVAAAEWADSLGADVISSSLGYNAPGIPGLTQDKMDGNTAVITRAADMAVGRGIIVVNAAGNNGFSSNYNTLDAPADGDSVITVGGVASDGSRYVRSSVGPTTSHPPRIKPDVMAMGTGAYFASAVATNEYGVGSGTSFACPLAAGVAALLLSAQPASTPMQIRDAMRNTASRASHPDNYFGWGVVNAIAALAYLDSSVIYIPSPPAYVLNGNFPNPFNALTNIAYALPEPAFVTLRIYDLTGRPVRTLVRTEQLAQEYRVQWNGADDRGRNLASGAYIYQLKARGDTRRFEASRKLVLVK